MRADGNNGFVLSSGRRFYANALVIGLDVDSLDVCEGWDGGVDVWADWTETPWTAEERRELAEYMIERWTAFRDAPDSHEPAP